MSRLTIGHKLNKQVAWADLIASLRVDALAGRTPRRGPQGVYKTVRHQLCGPGSFGLSLRVPDSICRLLTGDHTLPA